MLLPLRNFEQLEQDSSRSRKCGLLFFLPFVEKCIIIPCHKDRFKVQSVLNGSVHILFIG